MLPTIAVDLQADNRANVIEGFNRAATSLRDQAKLVPVGTKEDVSCTIVAADRVVSSIYVPMGASLREIIRAGREENTSVFNAAQLVAEAKADALVSFGSTAAEVIAARDRIGLIASFDAVGIACFIPTTVLGRSVILNDAGANAEVSVRSFVNSVLLGALVARVVLHARMPKVGLLSNGEEDTKGTKFLHKANKQLRNMSFVSNTYLPQLLEYVGFVEPVTVFGGEVDVVVTDGFTGNVFIKVAEATMNAMSLVLKRQLNQTRLSKFGALLARKQLRGIRGVINPDAHNGAILTGMKAPVIVGHGNSSPEAVEWAIYNAVAYATLELPQKQASVLAGFESFNSSKLQDL